MDWLLIEEHTLRLVQADAAAYKDAAALLNEAQKAVNELTLRINVLQQDNHRLTLERNTFQRENYLLRHPPWYKQPAVWGALGLTTGAVVTIVTVFLLKVAV